MTIDRAKSHILTEKSAGVWLFFFTKGKYPNGCGIFFIAESEVRTWKNMSRQSWIT